MLAEISKEFTHWEIFSEADHMVQALDDVFFEAAGKSGMTFSLHTSIADTNIAALNPRMREAAVMELMTELECAASMDIDTVTIHPGVICLSVPGTRDRSIAAAKESCRLLDRAAAEFGIEHVCIENMPRFPVMLGVESAELAEIVDGTDLGITFDIGHAHTAGQIDAMIETFGDRIANIHIHDNDGVRDLHQIPFTFTRTRENTSSTDWEGFIRGLQAIHFDGVLNFETGPSLNAFPASLHEDVLRLIAKIGEHFAKRITEA